jgi:predicted transcriptional regulator
MRENGTSIKSISRELSMSRKSVRKYLRAEPKGKQNRKKGSKLDPYREKIPALIDEHNLSVVRILEGSRKIGYDGGYTILKEYCHELRKDRRIHAVYTYETDPGKQSQVDFGEFGYIDIDGKRRKLYAFSMILGYSKMRYVEFTIDISTENVIRMHLNVFSFYGGFTDTILYDNMKQVVIDRKIKKPSGTYLAEVESVWENGKTRQKVIRYIGKEVEGKPVKRIASSSVRVKAVKRHLDIEIINRITAELGITDLRPGILAMVYSQLLDRPSINGMEEWLSHTDMLGILGADCMSTSVLYDALEELEEMDFSPIEASLSSIFSSIDEKNAVIVDITDTYFEGKSMSGDPRRGREEKVKKLMQIALAVTEKHGFPLFHRTYGGNISGRRIFREMISILRERGYESTIMDRGFYSRRNIKDALNLNVRIICGVIKDAEFRKILQEMQKDLIYRKENRIELKTTHVYAKSMDFMSGKIIMVYNPMLESISREQGGNTTMSIQGMRK